MIWISMNDDRIGFFLCYAAVSIVVVALGQADVMAREIRRVV